MTEMTREDIIRMAREAGGVDIESNGYTSWVGTQTTEFLERFAALVAVAAKAEEREACAVIAETAADCLQNSTFEGVAISIRARGEAK